MATYRTTGKKAAIDGISCVRLFDLQVTGVDTKSACSAAAGAVIRTAGNADWAVTLVAYGIPTKLPGEFCTFMGADRNGIGWHSADEDGVGTGALVDWVKIFCPTRAGRHIYYQMRLLGNGSIVKSDAETATDAATPAPLNPKGLSFYNGTAGTTQVNGILGWEFEIDGNSSDPVYPSYLNGWPGRDGGDIDAAITWTQTFDGSAQIPSVNDFNIFKLYVTATTYYEVEWGQVLRTPVNYPVEGNPPGKAAFIEAQNLMAAFSGYYQSTKGYIKKPGGTSYW